MKILSSIIFLCICTNVLVAGTQQQPCTLPVITYCPESIITCEGIESISIAVTTVAADSYQWKKGNTLIESQVVNNITIVTFNNVSIEDAGDYTVDVTNACGTVTSNIITFTVKPEGNAGHISGNESLCSGEIPSSISNIALNLGDDGFQTYIWLKKTVNGDWTMISGETGSSYTSTDIITESYRYRRMTTTVDGCFSNVVNKNVYSVVINNPETVCAGVEVQFSGIIEGVEDFSNTVYKWYLNNALVTQDEIYTTDSLKNGDKVQLAVISDICLAPIISNIVTAQVSSITTPSLTISGRSIVDICSPVDLTVTPINGGLSPSYRWIKNNISIDWIGNFGTLIEDNYVEGDIFTCEMTSSLACVTSSKVISNPVTAHITPYPLVSIGIITSGTLTNGQSIMLKAIPSEESPYSLSFTWYKNGQIVGDATETLNTIYNSGEVYTVKMDVSSWCINKTYSFFSEPLTLSSQFSTSISGPVSVLPNQEGVQYAVPDRTGMTYYWEVPDNANIVSGQGTHSIVVDFGVNANTFSANQRTAINNVITVKETNANDVSSTLTLQVSITTDTRDIWLVTALLIYPVPVQDACYIEIKEELSSQASVTCTLYDSKGLLITTGIGIDKIKIDMHAVPPGIYLLLVEKDGSIASKKVIKQ